ncbi:MAG: DUF58 domain-containing protein [Burkholderiales bacterium]|nr:DUF58 domain-containing protein [Burkholderiales bacterium]
MFAKLLARSDFFALVFGLRGPETGPIRLTQRRVYVLPTGYGLTFAGALALMLVGSINYSLGLGYVLTFALAGMGLVSMLHTYRNLAHLTVRAGRADPVFAGDDAVFELLLDNPGGFDRHTVIARCGESAVDVDIPAGRSEVAKLPVPAPRRGRLPLGRVTLETRFPVGLFRCWSYVRPEMEAIVWPRPDGAPLPLAKIRPDAGEAVNAGGGVDDFAGLRPYHAGDSPRHIAWKAAEREGLLLTKLFSGRGAAELWLDWDDLPSALDWEARLSRLAGWVLAAEAAGLAYGLRIPGAEIEPALGSAHRDACLTRLALFDAAPARP